jgi:nucleoside-diphosphate-sugar epimerase
VRLSPATHGDGSGMAFTGFLASAALRDEQVGYIGYNTWSAGHVDDAAVLYRLTLEKAAPGAVYHARGEEQVPIRNIAKAIGEYLGVPVVSVPADEADEYFAVAFVMSFDNKVSSAKTQRELGWKPTHGSVLDSAPATIDYIKVCTAKTG